MATGVDPPTFHDTLTVIDAHSDILIDITDGHSRLGQRYEPAGPTTACVRGQVDIPRLLEGGISGQILAIFVEEPFHDNPLRRALDMTAAFHRELAENSDAMILARRASDIRRAKQQGKIAMLLGLEGAEPLGTDVSLVRVFYELGIRVIGLTWNWRNAAADGWDASRIPRGLTPFGLALVEEMGKLGMVVDIAHLAKPSFWEVLEAARGPIIGSHCRTWGDWHRLDDDQLRAVAAQGGVICAIGVKQPSLDAIVDQITYIARVAGVDHVGFGADYYGLDLAPAGLEDATKYPALTAALLRSGFGPGDVERIMGGNLLRVFDEVLC
jgi:membrane dipeptidase